jgi:hypothetical protein
VLYAVVVGAAVGVVANILGWHRGRRARRIVDDYLAPERVFLTHSEKILRVQDPADFETTRTRPRRASRSFAPSRTRSGGARPTILSTRSTPRMKRGIPIFVSTLRLAVRSNRLRSRGRQAE